MRTLQFEAFLADLAVGKADGAVEYFLGWPGFHVSHLPGGIDGHLLVLEEDVAFAHDFHHATDESPSSAIRTDYFSGVPVLLDNPLNRCIPTLFILLPLIHSLLEPLAALHHLRLHDLHE